MHATISHRPKVFVALSGGVDSSVAAALLLKAATPKDFEKIVGQPVPEWFGGFEVYGIHIKMWSDPEIPCTTREDRYDAMRVAAKLNISFATWDFTAEYRRAVVEYMIREYAAGRTPNPDVMCNREIKFGVFLERAIELGADFVATGHYVRKLKDAGGDKLLRAKDSNKDQSYFLWTLTQEQLRRSLFPIGEYTKPEVRELARKFGLPTADKKDSQGLCFIGKIDFRAFLKKNIAHNPGPILTTDGQLLGEHDGLAFYTIGQRHGLGIGGSPVSRGIPYYVAAKDLSSNSLIVAESHSNRCLYKNELIARNANWIAGDEIRLPLECDARIRYRQPLQKCRVENAGDGDIRVIFHSPQRAVASGQSIVFYKAEEMLGGGVIL